jgi:ADP-ribose pyrophosphatase YjhB (NUDIX family)
MPLNKNRKYFTVVISSYVFFIRDNKILLSRRYKTGYHDGDYSLPAGHIEEKEFASEAATREILEEVGVLIEPKNLIPAHIMHRHCDNHERIDFFFSSKKWTGDLINAEPDKCDQLKWFPIEKLPKNTIPYIRTAIEKWNNGNFYSEFTEG